MMRSILTGLALVALAAIATPPPAQALSVPPEAAGTLCNTPLTPAQAADSRFVKERDRVCALRAEINSLGPKRREVGETVNEKTGNAKQQ